VGVVRWIDGPWGEGLADVHTSHLKRVLAVYQWVVRWMSVTFIHDHGAVGLWRWLREMMKWFSERIKMNATTKAHERTRICYEDISGRYHYQVHARLEGAVLRKRRPGACRCMDLKHLTW
jgi:hypothetical protein